MNETIILKKLRAGDPAGLEALMDRYIPYVSAVVWHILRGHMSQEDGEEVVSDVFLAAWRQAEQLEPGRVKGWLGAVARNTARNKLRQMGKTLPLEEDGPLLLRSDSGGDLPGHGHERLHRQDQTAAGKGKAERIAVEGGLCI